MAIEQVRWSWASGWVPHPPGRLEAPPQLVLVFGDEVALQNAALAEVRRAWPDAAVFGCSTAGEICGTHVGDGTLVVTAVRFAYTAVRGGRVPIEPDSAETGARLAALLPHEGLRHAFVLADGLAVDGTALARGLRAGLPPRVAVTGGLAGDGNRFQRTQVVWDGSAAPGTAAIVGFYGDRFRVGYGCMGGWGAFGPERLVTRARGRVLYELDGQPALALYKKYLGEHAAGLPATGLLFPLMLRTRDGVEGLGRAVLGIDEAEQSVIFAGDMPEGAYARLMMANHDRLLDGAVEAARSAREGLGDATAALAVLVSCAGRKLVLDQAVEDEVESVREVLGEGPALAGFYAYGELAPLGAGSHLELQNQTMSVTTLAER